MNEYIDEEGTKFFQISLACELMQKSTKEVLNTCKMFGATSFTNENMGDLKDDWKIMYPDEDIEINQQYKVRISFQCNFKIQDYEAFCFISFHFVNDIAVECVISLGTPIIIERYSSEKSVMKVFIVSLEKKYLNGRIKQNLQERVYTWKKDSRTLVSFVSYSPYDPTSTVLSVQIRDTQLHPQRRELEILYYNETMKRVEDLNWVQEIRSSIPFEKLYKGRRILYIINSLLFIGMILLIMGGIITLFFKNFIAATVMIVLGILCGYLTSKLYSKAVKGYLQKKSFR